jgi:lipopolysaccharide transport system ATP-binding protein
VVNSVAIRVEGLGKQYRLGAARERYSTLRDQIGKLVSARRWTKRDGRNSSKRDELFWALRDVSFEVKRGDVIGIIGRNGAGKSTLLKILGQITEPTEGEVDVHGRVGSLLEVGTGFHPELTGRENVVLNGAILGMRRGEISRKFDEIVAFAEVERFIDTPVKYYSSGMYLRLAFAVAAHLEPEILLVDEVLAVGDAQFQKRCLGKMSNIAREGRTIVFVSHQLGVIETLCSRAIYLLEGRVCQIGPVGDIVREYLTRLSTKSSYSDISNMVRTGNGRVRLVDFWVEDHFGARVTSVSSGGRVVLNFRYNSSDRLTSRVSLGFSLHTASEQTVALLYSDYQGVTFDGLPSSGVLRFTIPRLALSYGTYFVGVRILVGGAEADWPRGFVARIDVEAGDYYGLGQSFHSGIGPMLLDGEWHSGLEVHVGNGLGAMHR